MEVFFFDRIWLGQRYAEDVYRETKHIHPSELADRELLPDQILRLMVNAFVIEKCGVKLLEQEVVGED